MASAVADDWQHSRHHQRHNHHLRLSVPTRSPFPTAATSGTPRSYPVFPTPTPSASTPFPVATPSKRRRSSFSLPYSSTSSYPNSAVSSVLLLLLSLRSLYSLLPFLRSVSLPSVLPFCFLVSLLSLFLTAAIPSPSDALPRRHSLPLRPILAKSLLLTLVFVLRFHAIRTCATAAAAILADFAGSLAARSLAEKVYPSRSHRIRGLLALSLALFLLATGWDRASCAPAAFSTHRHQRLVVADDDGACMRVLPTMLPFFSGFLAFFERASNNWAPLRQFGRKRVRLLSLGFATAMLAVPAALSFLLQGGGASLADLGWPLANTVIFGVVLSDSYILEKSSGSGGGNGSKNSLREFLPMFLCTLVLSLFYFPQLSLPGLLFCGLLIWVAVDQLSLASSSGYVELGTVAPSESLHSLFMNPIRHILSERKSRKIALFLLINAAYMVVEFVAGFMSNSLGLISDACHMLFDCAALAIGLYASYISRLPANSQFNYGRGRFEVLSGYVNAVFLVLVGALIVLESLERILDPQDISTTSLLTVSIGGLLVNVVGLVFFHEEHHHAHGGGSCSHSHSHTHSHSHPDPHNHSHSHSHTHSHPDSHNHSHTHSHSDSHSHTDNHQHHHLDENCSHHHSETNSKQFTSEPSVGNNHGGHDDVHYHHTHHPEKPSNFHIVMEHTHNQLCNHSHDDNRNDHEHHNHDRIRSGSEFDAHDGHKHGKHCETDHSSAHVCCHEDGGHRNEHSHENHNHAHPDSLNVSLLANDSHSHLHSNTVSVEVKPLEKHGHRHIDHNMEGIFLHVLADTMGSVGVVISTLLIKYKGWLAADPLCSIFISVMIVSSVLPLLRNSAEVLMQRVSRAHEHDLKVALDEVLRVDGVCDVQNVHVWNFTNTEVVGTLRLQISVGTDMVSAKKQVSHILHDAGVKDLTIQVEQVRG